MKYDYEAINEQFHPIIKGTLVGPSKNEELTIIEALNELLLKLNGPEKVLELSHHPQDTTEETIR